MLTQIQAVGAKLPSIDARSDRYHLRLARTEAEIDAVLKLRFDVFNLELGEGLDSAYAEMRDRDRFDQHCLHLLVDDTTTAKTIGTYRLIPYAIGREHGFYSDDEFVLADLPATTLRQSIELGRACIAAEHRNTRVLYLLWLGLARYMQASGARYFFGCCSLTSQDPTEALGVADFLDVNGHRRQDFRVRVRESYQLPMTSGITPARAPIPKLMRLYLQYGAEIVSEAAIDRQFKTIDFLALFDIESLDRRARRLFGLDER
ncbi:MAG: GNAT family N-acyltransferase [Pseudomonadota bacterium]